MRTFATIFERLDKRLPSSLSLWERPPSFDKLRACPVPDTGTSSRRVRASALRSAWGVSLVLFAASVAAEPESLRNTSCAYDADSKQLLYSELHEQKVENGRPLDGSVTYFDPAGKQIAAKTLDYRNNPFVPIFRLEIPQQDYAEGINDNRDAVALFRKSRKHGEQTKRVIKKSSIAADAGVHQFVKANFKVLVEGKVLSLRLPVAGHLDTYSVRVRHAADLEFDSRPAVRFRIEHDSPLALLLDPVEMTYDRETQRLLQYSGTSNMRDPSTGDAYKKVRIVYYSGLMRCQ